MDQLPDDMVRDIAGRLCLQDLRAFACSGRFALKAARQLDHRRRRGVASLPGRLYYRPVVTEFVRRIQLVHPRRNTWRIVVVRNDGPNVSIYLRDPILQLSRLQTSLVSPCTFAGRLRSGGASDADGLQPKLTVLAMGGTGLTTEKDEPFIRDHRLLRLRVAVVPTDELTTLLLSSLSWTTLSIPLLYEGPGRRTVKMDKVENDLQSGKPTAVPFRMAASYQCWREKRFERSWCQAISPGGYAS